MPRASCQQLLAVDRYPRSGERAGGQFMVPRQMFLWWWRGFAGPADKNFLGPDMIVQPIDEFPFFSFLLGDNHPHVLALPFVLLAIGLAFNLLIRQMGKKPIMQQDLAD